MHVAESREVGAHVAVSRRSRGCVIGARGLRSWSWSWYLQRRRALRQLSPIRRAFTSPPPQAKVTSAVPVLSVGLTNLARLESHPHVSVTECTLHNVDEDEEEIVRFATPRPRRTVQRNCSNGKITGKWISELHPLSRSQQGSITCFYTIMNIAYNKYNKSPFQSATALKIICRLTMNKDKKFKLSSFYPIQRDVKCKLQMILDFTI